MEGNEKKAVVSLLKVFLFFVFLLTALFGVGLFLLDSKQNEQDVEQKRLQIVTLNEIEEKTKVNQESPAKAEIHQLQEQLKNQEQERVSETGRILTVGYLSGMLFLALVFLYTYIHILRPFETLQKFASKIAKGDFNEVLLYERTNLFGEFTWAFDHMRREIIKARSKEKEAIENNKTVIATLSHDIKTPIASIRTYTEALEANMDSTYERRQKYLGVILQKCEEVTVLTNDLFLHSISDLDKLSIEKEPVQLQKLLVETVEEQKAAGMNIFCEPVLSSLQVSGDAKRLKQVFMNLISNSDKYAKGQEIRIWTTLLQNVSAEPKLAITGNTAETGMVWIHFKDTGKGVSPKDVPFLCDKFYRGEQSGEIPGAGLGLYIVKYVMEQSDGEVELKNVDDGFEVILKMPYLIL